MIKNQKQGGNSRERLAELKKAKEELIANKESKDAAKYKLGLKAFDGLIKDLEHQLNTYELLVNGNFHCWKPESLEEISNVLISARLAQKMSQKDLGDLLGLKEQQIQRYESTDYETASWPRIVEIAMALKLKFYFEKIIIINTEPEKFHYPEGITAELVELAAQKVKNRNSLILG